MQKHKHCDVIKKWADGWIIEFYDTYVQMWKIVPKLTWDECTAYRAIHPDFPNEYKAWLEGKEVEYADSYDSKQWFILNSVGYWKEKKLQHLPWDIPNHVFRIKQTRNKELDEALYKAFLVCHVIKNSINSDYLSSYAVAHLLKMIGQ
ncbi:MAG TPA: hypothetical protein VFM18_05015 [Methanosarcina sp.]|nr:hypothetical protein [Methanosarcina sp.]